MRPVQVKVCGITRLEDALDAAQLGVELLGFNFWPSSRRYCAPEVAAAIVRRLPPSVQAVGVFVNQPRHDVEAVAAQVGLHALQLHGDEPPEACVGYRLPVIKALPVLQAPSLEALRAWPAAALLFDAPVRGYGGGGRSFPWELVAGVSAHLPVVLAGGLTPENVGEAVRCVRPRVVDVASGVEVAPGVKDVDRMARFVAAAKEA